jgi:hypothetical protein
MLRLSPVFSRCAPRSALLVGLWFWVLASLPVPGTAAPCAKQGCYENICLVQADQNGKLVPYIVDILSSPCNAFFTDATGNNLMCKTQSAARNFYQALAAVVCDPNVNVFGTTGTTCTKTGDKVFSFNCCKTACGT